MEALVEAGADIDKASDIGDTPLIRAAEEGHTAAVEWLLEDHADFHTKWHVYADYHTKMSANMSATHFQVA